MDDDDIISVDTEQNDDTDNILSSEDEDQLNVK